MHLTTYSDYALRVLIYLGLQDGRLVTIKEIADSYGISKSHLMKLVHQLGLMGYIETLRGKNGGMRLNRSPEEINLGVLLRETEQNFELVECFSFDNQCRITPVCNLKHILADAMKAFLDILDQHTLKDLLADREKPQLLRLLQIA
ncbi:RrF2 family transcriptional regulator [Marinobacter sp.]|uniref:RrF2 family transcriptional regulator n=1 Tax=Marinobacter sp. TaxID=50741 RepID=UPI0038505EA1